MGKEAHTEQNNYRPSSTRIADLCNDDKPREKALAHGIRTLSDTELIAILLGAESLESLCSS